MLKKVLIFLTLVILCVLPSCGKESRQIGKTEVFAEVGEGMHGIVFDNNGNMFIGKGKSVLRITSTGKVSSYITLDSGNQTKNTHIYGMTFGKDKNLYLAAQDRIIKITPDKKVKTVVKEDFDGLTGVSDVKFDPAGNMYVAFDNKVVKYDTLFKKTTYIDGTDVLVDIKNIYFDKDFRNIYICGFTSSNIVKYSINSKGKAVNPQVEFDAMPPFNVAIGSNDDIFASIPWGSGILMIKDKKVIKNIDGGGMKMQDPQDLAFGKKGFDEESLYVITSSRKLFKIYVGCKDVH